MWLVALVVVALLGAAWWWQSRPRIEDPALAATTLAETWSTSGLAAVEFATDPPPPPPDEIAAITADLLADPPAVTVQRLGEPDPEQQRVAVDLTVTWTLPGGRTWSHGTTATLVRADEALDWEVAWDPRLVHPDLTVGERLEIGRTTADRGRILDASGEVLVGPERVTVVGLHPARIDDLDEVVTTLVDELDDTLDGQLDPDAIRADVAAADPEHFVPVVTLRNDDYRRVEPVVFPLVGTTFRDDVLFLGPDRDFATFTLGTVGEVSAEQLEESPDRWAPGDLAGRSGLQADRDEDLAGTPGWTILAVDAEGAEEAVLHEVDPTAGRDLTVTLDRRVQRLAQEALADVGTPAALAVVRPTDGAVLALANSPDATFDIARTGQLPPGSVFKVVTTAALEQEAGITPDSPVACPNTIEVGDRTIANAGSLALGETTFAQGFANSCNTVFIDESRDLPPTALHDAATRFGIGAEVTWPLGMSAFTGDVPATTDATDLALASFGQGRTLVNPLAMATVMATVAQGERVLPRLVVDPEATDVGEATDDEAVDGPPATVLADLQDLTRLVVTDGSGRALEDLPGPEVHGKTGTADFLDEDGNLRQHAWFAGYRDDLAFALVVTDTDGGSGGGTAAPLVRDFLVALDAD